MATLLLVLIEVIDHTTLIKVLEVEKEMKALKRGLIKIFTKLVLNQ